MGKMTLVMLADLGLLKSFWWNAHVSRVDVICRVCAGRSDPKPIASEKVGM